MRIQVKTKQKPIIECWNPDHLKIAFYWNCLGNLFGTLLEIVCFFWILFGMSSEIAGTVMEFVGIINNKTALIKRRNRIQIGASGSTWLQRHCHPNTVACVFNRVLRSLAFLKYDCWEHEEKSPLPQEKLVKSRQYQYSQYTSRSARNGKRKQKIGIESKPTSVPTNH